MESELGMLNQTNVDPVMRRSRGGPDRLTTIDLFFFFWCVGICVSVRAWPQDRAKCRAGWARVRSNVGRVCPRKIADGRCLGQLRAAKKEGR
jgi:hypothetical protein